MKKKEVEVFIDRVMESEKCNEFYIVCTYCKNDDMENKHAYVRILKPTDENEISDGALLYLNRKTFIKNTKFDLRFQMAILLHEIGHVFTVYSLKGNKEYNAQMWAYNKAIEFEMIEILELIKDVFIDWKNFDKRSKYYEAWKIANRNGVLK